MQPLAAQARQAKADADFHKRQVSRHRQLLRQARRRQAELEAECRRLGIDFIVTGEGNSHGPRSAETG